MHDLAGRLGIGADILADGVDALVRAGMLEQNGGSRAAPLTLTGSGRDALDRLSAARRDSLTELLEGWDPESHPELVGLIHNLAHALLADDTRLLADAGVT